jgi:PAS domain S-box-containing protein
LQTRRIIGLEVLARWQHPTRQIVHPTEFIPIAEQNGLIGALTGQVLRRACLAAAEWPADIQISVNLSSLQLREPALPDRLNEIAEQASFPFNRLTFEITESATIEDYNLPRSILGNLRSLGAHLALDDFGTGYSGLRHLQLLPFDTLKLDAAFVRTMTTHRESRKIVAAVMGLCQNLGLASVAEGIENESQLEMLLSLGYGTGQGWLFSRPVPASHIPSMLKDSRPATSARSMARIAEQVALRLEALPIQCLWQLQALYEGAPVGLAFVDRDLRYLAVNEQLAEMHRLPIAAFLGRRLVEVIPEVIDQVEPRFRRALAGEAVKDSTTLWPSNREQQRAVRSSYQPVRDAAGEIIGVSVAIVDTADRNAGDSALRSQPLQLPDFG